jgi:hypothetical protein
MNSSRKPIDDEPAHVELNFQRRYWDQSIQRLAAMLNVRVDRERSISFVVGTNQVGEHRGV